uniref:CW domain-containing protein n=1 Tax=Caenorhabditis japonica TaxID=281687 RepID=A0A8R1HW34_CAEJA
MFVVVSIVLSTCDDSSYKKMTIMWGYPEVTTSQPSNTSISWDQCLLQCYQEDSCVLVHKTSFGCDLYRFNSISSARNPSPPYREDQIAFKTFLSTDTCPISPFVNTSTYSYHDDDRFVYSTTTTYSVDSNNDNIITFNYTTLECPIGSTVFPRGNISVCLSVKYFGNDTDYPYCANYSMASALCKKNGGILTGPLNTEEYNYFKNVSPSVTKIAPYSVGSIRIWLDGNSVNETRVWVMEDPTHNGDKAYQYSWPNPNSDGPGSALYLYTFPDALVDDYLRGSTTNLDTVTTLGSGYADLCKISFVFSQVPCGDRRSLWALYSSRVSPFGVTLVGVPVSCRLSLAATSAISTTDIDRIEGPLCAWIRWPGSLVGSLGWRIRCMLSPLVLDPRAHGFVGLARSLARLAGGFVARCPRWFWIRRDVVGRADVPRRAPCDWQDSCSCFWMDSCRACCSLVEDFCPVAELITSESMSCPVLVRPVRMPKIQPTSIPSLEMELESEETPADVEKEEKKTGKLEQDPVETSEDCTPPDAVAPRALADARKAVKEEAEGRRARKGDRGEARTHQRRARRRRGRPRRRPRTRRVPGVHLRPAHSRSGPGGSKDSKSGADVPRRNRRKSSSPKRSCPSR